MAKISAEVAPGFEEEKIHKMRTTVKKIRALAHWTGFPLGKSFRKIYKVAGKIRETQLLINNKEVLPDAFSNWLQNRLVQLEDEWTRLYKKEEIKKQVNKLHKKSRLLQSHSVEKFSKEKNETLHVFKNQRPLGDEQIHNGRKSIKEIDYVNSWLSKQDNLPHEIASEKTLKKVTDDTGNFMDVVSAIKLLDEYISQEPDEANRTAANVLRTRWIEEKEEEKNKLIKSIDSHNFSFL